MKIQAFDSMLDYSKYILKRVSFNKQLFKDELIKAINWVYPWEKKKLQAFVYSNFNKEYPDVINEVFNS